MSGNIVKKSLNVGKTVKQGIELSLEVAVETSLWIRTSKAAESVGAIFKDAVEKSAKELPEGTKTLIMR